MNMKSAMDGAGGTQYAATLDMFKVSYLRFALTHAQLGLVYALQGWPSGKGFEPHETIDWDDIARLIESLAYRTMEVSYS